MKVLWLTNSDDTSGSAVPDHLRSYRLAAEIASAATGEDVEMVPKVIWPAPELPDIIDGWIKRYRPDVVYFKMNGYWYLYHSVPRRIERWLGAFGKPVARAGERAGRTNWLAKTWIFNAVRMGFLKTIGGDRFFEPPQVVEHVEACLRKIVQHEDMAVVVQSQIADWDDVQGELHVQSRLRPLCASLHVPFIAKDPRRKLDIDYFGSGDRLHTDEAGHRYFAAIESKALIEAWEALKAGRAGAER